MRYVRIKPYSTDRPYRRRAFTVKCHDRTIFTTVTSTPAVVRSWLFKVRSTFYRHLINGRLVVGLGVQWRDSKSEPATIQLCVGRFCLVFQLLYASRVPRALRQFLSNPSVTFAGVWNNLDADMLSRSRHELDVSRLIDVRRVAAERRGMPLQSSMEKLATAILGLDGVDKPMEIGRSNWNVSTLSHKQVTYACVDAFISFCLGRDLDAWDWNIRRNACHSVYLAEALSDEYQTYDDESDESEVEQHQYHYDDEYQTYDDESDESEVEQHQYHYDEDFGSYLN